MKGDCLPSSPIILYEDNHLIGVYKPSGVLTQASHTQESCLMETVRQWLKKKYDKPGNVFLGMVQRLDRPVSGIVVFAKTSKGASRLSQQFRTQQVKKIYWALVKGIPKQRQAEIGAALGWDGYKKRAVVYSSVTLGIPRAKLSYTLMRTVRGLSFLEINPVTGRKHQIRALMSDLGHPIVGDRKYGSSLRPFGAGIALFAKSIEFCHPTRVGERICIEVPQDYCQFLNYP